MEVEKRLQQVLEKRRREGKLRVLRVSGGGVDFASNDYLGLAREEGVFQRFVEERVGKVNTGATGSRLLSGHSRRVEQVERTAALFHDAEGGLLFTSGYDANLSLLGCLPNRGDAVVYDEFIHASVHDGMRLSRVRECLYSFGHNDLHDLQSVLQRVVKKHEGVVWVCVETVYSMDGDVTDLESLLDILQTQSQVLNRQILLLADEAHAGNLYGCKGQGLAYALGVHLHKHLFARVITFGKGFAAHGAVILGSATLVQYLINYARPFIYSTAPPPHTVAVIAAAYEFAQSKHAQRARERLWALVRYFQYEAKRLLPQGVLLSTRGISPIQGLLIRGNECCVRAAERLSEEGFEVFAIRSPTVPKGKERIRVIVHAHNSEGEIDRFLRCVVKVVGELTAKL